MCQVLIPFHGFDTTNYKFDREEANERFSIPLWWIINVGHGAPCPEARSATSVEKIVRYKYLQPFDGLFV
jgi:hypothetical protein